MTHQEASLPLTNATDYHYYKTGRHLTGRPCPLADNYESQARAGGRLACPPHHPMWEDITAKQINHEAISPGTDSGIIHLITSEARGLKRMHRRLQNRPERCGSLQPTSTN
jgi:hypothetical protein